MKNAIKNLKKFANLFKKLSKYEGVLNEKKILCNSFISGIDSILYPKEFIEKEKLLKKKSLYFSKGVEKGIKAYLKENEFKFIHFILIAKIEKLKDNVFLKTLLNNLLKYFSLISFEIKKEKKVILIFLTIDYNKKEDYEDLNFILKSILKLTLIELYLKFNV